jgi:hypothetical protein
MVMGRGQAYCDFRNCSGAGWFNHRAEAGDFGFSTYNAGGVNEMGRRYIELRASRFMKTIPQ